MAKKFGKFLMFSAAVAAAAGAYYYFKKSDEDRFDDDDFDNDFEEEEKDLSGGKERSYVPLRFSTVKSEEETAAEEAKEDVPAEPVRPEEPAVDPVVSGQEEKPAVEEVKEAVSPAAEGKEETPAPEPKEEKKRRIISPLYNDNHHIEAYSY